jgi:vacuole morphology and inheritance protein 14
LIIRQLCVLLNAERTYRTFARLLQNQEVCPSSFTLFSCELCLIHSIAFAQDLDFVSVMVQTLNLILMTSSELFELRSMLKQSLVSEEGRDRFTLLYKTWYVFHPNPFCFFSFPNARRMIRFCRCHNPVATFSLCLMTQCYELGSALIFNLY